MSSLRGRSFLEEHHIHHLPSQLTLDMRNRLARDKILFCILHLSGNLSPQDAQAEMSHHGESGEFYQDETGFVSSCTTPRSGLTGMFNHSGLAFSVIELKHLTEEDDFGNQAQ